MKSSSFPHSDPCNHSRSPWPNPQAQVSCSADFSSFLAESTTAAPWHEGWKRCSLSLSSDWFNILGSIKDDFPKGDRNSSRGSLQSQTLDQEKLVVTHALPRGLFGIHDLTVLYRHPLFPRKGNWEGNSRPKSESAELLQHLHNFLAVNTEIVLFYVMDGLFISCWWKTAVRTLTLHCLPHQKFMKLCHPRKI